MPRKRKKTLPPLKLGRETTGQRLSRLRKERGLTQKELAEKIGVGPTIISDYETGRLMFNGEMVARLAIALSVSADTILGLKQTTTQTEATPSVRILRRLKKISTLPPQKKKRCSKQSTWQLRRLRGADSGVRFLCA
ncbi:MAG: helix-turn-helix domain-containing protein [Spirochaetia bacterium]